MSLLAAALAQLNRGGSAAVGLEIQSTRALFAAESGAQIAAMKIFPINNGAATCSGTATTQNFTAAGLNNCSATYTCASSNAAGRTVYTITSEGKCSTAGSADYTRRKITVGLRSL